MPMDYNKEIIAVLDPMCSWCWGFEPVLEKLQHSLPANTTLSLVLGGLRNKGDQIWDDDFKSYLREHWSNVHHKTGQTFNMEFLDQPSFDYDTEPACRAAVVVRELDITKQFTFFRALQKAFYKHARDISSKEVILHIVAQVGIDRESFIHHFHSREMRDKTQADAYKARSMGANVFPSLVLIDEEGHLCVLKGYRGFDEIKKFIDK